MPEPHKPLRRFFQRFPANVESGLISSLIYFALSSAFPTLIALREKLRNEPFDWVMIIGSLFLSLFLFSMAFWLTSRNRNHNSQGYPGGTDSLAPLPLGNGPSLPKTPSGRSTQAQSGNLSGIVAHKTWNEVDEIFSRAEKSIEIIDSFFLNEIGAVAHQIGEAVHHGARKLDLSIFMASPEMDFAVQRTREIGRFKAGNHIPFKKKLWAPITDGERESYTNAFYETYVPNIYRYFTLPEVNPMVFKYPSLPATRIYRIDDKHFVFGWFPLFERNPTYICLSLTRSDNLSDADAEVVQKLTEQIEHIKAISELVPEE
jgi:hypothetical protein